MVSLPTTSGVPPANGRARGAATSELDIPSSAASAVDSRPEESAVLAPSGLARANATSAADRAERRHQLPAAIRKRIESRLAGRVRNLIVRTIGGTIVLEGKCATFYTKQLAQHAALGVLEDGEHLENAIVVDVPR
jgi:hypothetical protein